MGYLSNYMLKIAQSVGGYIPPNYFIRWYPNQRTILVLKPMVLGIPDVKKAMILPI